MAIVNVYLEDNQGIEELMNNIDDIEEVKGVKQSESLAAGAAIMLGIKIALITIPAIIKIVKAIRKKINEKKEVTVTFKCPDSKEKVKFTFSGIDDEKLITNIVNKAYKATCD